MSRQAPLRQRRFFTLLELAIAVAILLSLTIVLFGYARGVSQNWAKILQEKNRFQELLGMDRVIDATLSHAIPFTWTSDQASREDRKFPFLVAQPNFLRIAYLHDLHDPVEGALRFGEFQVQDGNLYFTYTDRPFYQWSDLGGRDQTVLLAEGISHIAFSYLDWSGDQNDNWEDRWLWLDEWETEDSQRLDLPLAIRMTVYWTNGRQETWMRRTMGNAYRERFGKWNPLEEDKR